ncbi:cobyrinate a,c-diamide synthase [Allorhizocola rhizosphaerae]|uniref:cobyrinate a,c-diamide synthase n=1 Tax=Allorhizocola rhizosphaerae TaxID=1872709 RepID=UPI000E3C87F6|nr:cobyrinate a,c-diamide synthase [Allorhizocola rhizosphaerae]
MVGTFPRLVIAAPGSGHGKTTVVTGLLKTFAKQGIAVAGFKVGPDYIDPSYHELACGRPGRNLDPVLVGEGLIAPLFAHGAAAAEVSIVEGVMGLYDGRSGAGGLGSTAHVARLLDAPVVLVVDARGQGRSIAALLHGFRTFGASVRIAGAILNQVGSDRHELVLREACAEVGVPVLGVLRRSVPVAVPSRHLGLVPVAERAPEAVHAVEAMASLVAGGVDLPALLALANSAPSLPVRAWAPPVTVVKGRPTVAVAGGPAFSFGYREQLELLSAVGAEVTSFDPLRDEKLPDGTAAVVVNGGFPEVYGEQLAANEPLRRQVRDLALSGAPVVAECAGLLWLGRMLDGHEMCGVLDSVATMTDRLTLGYRDAVAVTPSVLAGAGTRVTGHEFHRTQTTPECGPRPAWSGASGGFVQAGVHASYLHTHWAGYPGFAQRLVEAAAASCG